MVFFSAIRQSELYVSKKRDVRDIISHVYHALRAWKNWTSGYNFSPFGAEMAENDEITKKRVLQDTRFWCILFVSVVLSDFCTKWAEILATSPVFYSLSNE